MYTQERSDLQAAFPTRAGTTVSGSSSGSWTTGRDEEDPGRAPARDPPPQRRPLRAPSIGRSQRRGVLPRRGRSRPGGAARTRRAPSGAGIPYSTFTYDKTRAGRRTLRRERRGAYDVNLICVNADQLPASRTTSGPDFFRDRHSIGIWWWEVARFPERFHSAFELVSEVWVGSDFVREAIAAETDKPVLSVPLGIELPAETPLAQTRASAFPRASSSSSRSTSTAASSGRTRWPHRGVPARISGRTKGRRSCSRRSTAIGTSRPRAAAVRHGRPCRHPRRRRVSRPPRRRRAHRRLRLLRVAPPQRGIRPDHRRGDGAREAGDRNRLLRKSRVHERTTTATSFPTR